MPNQPATPNRSIRVPDDLWDEVLRIAHDRHMTATAVILLAVKRYVDAYPGD